MSLKEKNEVFDYHQEVARSAFADMLHDTERNQKYSMALKKAIQTMKTRGLKANVLDIGTGTGLLSMLAAKHEADSVVTIEAFSPVSNVARKIIEKNGFKNQIRIINKHSTEVEVGPGKDMEHKANILVAEVFDTELIGEGAIKTYNHAHKNLMEDDCICVPDCAFIFIQVVECPTALKWNLFSPTISNVKCPDNIAKCSGVHSIHDLQLSQLDINSFKSIAGPFNICKIDFSGREVIKASEEFSGIFVANKGVAHLLFFWWEVRMDVCETIVLSCAPHWYHPDTNYSGQPKDEIEQRNSIPWRDHWMQGCYYFNSMLEFEQNETGVITAFHDEFSWWFDIQRADDDNQVLKKSERPMCSCLFHMVNSRNRINNMNNCTSTFHYLMTDSSPDKNKSLLFVGDHNIQPFAATSHPKVSKVYLLQDDLLCFKSMQNIVTYNKSPIQIIKDLKEIGGEIIYGVIGEPYYNSSVLPWDNITKFWKQIQQLKVVQKDEFRTMPYGACIYAVPVKFLNLHKIRWPLKSTCEGFDHELFDKVVEIASLMADENVEPFSLWEYPCIALGEPTNIFQILFNDNKIKSFEKVVYITESSQACNGIAFWIENILSQNNDEERLSCGPSTKIKTGELISWKLEHRQGVHLIPSSNVESGIRSIKISTRFDQVDDKLVMEFCYL